MVELPPKVSVEMLVGLADHALERCDGASVGGSMLAFRSVISMLVGFV
jgi:hypothetical protein